MIIYKQWIKLEFKENLDFFLIFSFSQIGYRAREKFFLEKDVFLDWLIKDFNDKVLSCCKWYIFNVFGGVDDDWECKKNYERIVFL
jgi:hypothetical protein